MEKKSADQLHNMQQGQQPHKPTNKDQNSSSVRKDHEEEEEYLTTGGPVNRSSIEGKGDHGVINAHTGGMTMGDEELNTSKDDFPDLRNTGRAVTSIMSIGGGSFSAKHKFDLDEVEPDYSQDKTEGIINPRSTISEWSDWKTSLKGGGEVNEGEGNTDRDAKEFNDIAPV